MLVHALDPRLAPMDVVYAAVASVKQTLIPICIMGGVLILITMAVQFVVTGFGISLKKLTPDISRLNPLPKMRQLPRQNMRALFRRSS